MRAVDVDAPHEVAVAQLQRLARGVGPHRELAAGHVLLERLEAVGGEVELEEMTVHNSFGRVELVLATWRRPSAPTA